MALSKSYNYTQGEAIQSFSNNNYSMTLAANTEQHFTVPGFSQMGQSLSGSQNQLIVIINPQSGTNVWVANNETAEVANASVDATTSTLITSAMPIEARKFRIRAGDILSFITADTSAYVGINIYQG